METRRRKHWGWGYEDEQPAPAQLREQGAAAVAYLGFGQQEVEMPLSLEDVKLPQPRVQPPAALAEICDGEIHARASHALGKSYCDVVKGFRGQFAHPPDFVAAPRDEVEIEALLEWCETQRVAAIPYGGGTSVVGGVEPRVPAHCNGAISIDLLAMEGLLEVDQVSRAARIRAGTTGPAVEAALAQHDLTLRHFPQSFELSTLGGWIATRAGGHFATLWTHIDEMVESVRAIAPAGVWESRRLPGSGAGPSPDRMLIGSEGALGVITEAWVRVLPRPGFRAQAGVRFVDFDAGAQCVKQISQADLHPANCRLIDPIEAGLTGAGDGRHALLVLGFESADHSVQTLIDRALAICAEHGGEWDQVKRSAPGPGASEPRGAGGAVSTWRDAFMQAPYLRDTLVAAGVLCETFETATTWERFDQLHERVSAAAADAIAQTTGVACGPGHGEAHLTCRFTHVYPDGPALYYTVLAPAVRGEEVSQWQTIKAAVSDALIEQGATITHHHAVGRDHRLWYDRQRPDLFAAALRGAKAQLDPRGIMNPGVLIDPLPASEAS
ncbi:MAG: FAD-binding oxidoreductase [Solirubrobacteraceae bacterium]